VSLAEPGLAEDAVQLDADIREQLPYGRCVIYTFPGDAEEIISKARTGILPIFKNQPGFVAYGVMVRGNHLISTSAWKSESDANSADELVLRVGS
jgi:hypothetical protein